MPRLPSVLNALRAIRPKWIGIGLFSALIIVIVLSFFSATISAWRAQERPSLSCGTLPTDTPHSYIQYGIKDQAVEPYFKGNLFINLGEASGPSQAEITTTAAPLYGSTVTHVELFHDEQNKTFWMRKESEEIPLVRKSGAPSDFPFDTTTVEFDTTFNPPLLIRGVVLRNFNPSFNLPCDQVEIRSEHDRIHVKFVMRRKPLVQLMAVVIMVSAALFALIIPFTVKREALSTSVASFFFSVWSTRGILASEMKVFPTIFDMAILVLCVVLLLMIGIRLLWTWAKSPPAVKND